MYLWRFFSYLSQFAYLWIFFRFATFPFFSFCLRDFLFISVCLFYFGGFFGGGGDGLLFILYFISSHRKFTQSIQVNVHEFYDIFNIIYDYFILYQVIVMEGPITERFAKAAADRNSSTAAPTQPSVTMPTVPKVTEILVQISRRTRLQNLVPSSSLRLQMAPRQPVELCQPSESLTILPITGANQIVVKDIVPRSSVHQVVKNLRPLASGFNPS